jgi:hypothetical protein
MAYNTNTPRAEYTASATQTVFPFLFKIFATSDIKVYQTLAGATPDDVADILVLTTDYTVTINGDAGGEVTLNTGAAVNDKITLARNLSITRATEYQQNGDLLASTLNADQEYQTYLIADNESNDNRYIKIPDSVQNVSTSLPAPASDAYIKWNATANAIENDTTIPDAVIASAANATQAELYEWEAEAERLTADSYATEAEDTFVNIVTSDGDGTFTYTPTTDYSALHYSLKAATFNPAIYAPLASPALTGTPTVGGDAIKYLTAQPSWTGVDIGGGETLYPDGTIYGVNANGSYTKYPNGDLVMKGSVYNATHAVTTAVGSIFYSPTAETFTFPSSFIGTHDDLIFSASLESPSGTSIYCAMSRLLATDTNVSARLISGATTTIIATFTFIVIGRWK